MISINEESNLYKQIAQQIVSLIEQKALKVGDKVPSLRKLSNHYNVSIGTVLQAYHLLEEQRFIEARPQSGYFVKVRSNKLPAEPKVSDPIVKATKISLIELSIKMMLATQRQDIIQLGAAIPNPELLPTHSLNRSMASIGRRLGKKLNSYDSPPGNETLRTQVALKMMEAGCTLTPDQIVTTCGGQEALNLCLRAVAKAGDTIAIESPTFHGILQIIESLGMQALELPTCPRDGVDLDVLQTAIKKQQVKACLFVTNFSNPLGSCMPDEKKQQLVEILRAKEIPLIEDDIYGDLSFSASRPKTAKAFDKEGLVLLCSSFSKTLAPSYRVGWVAPGRFKEKVMSLKFINTIATATLPQLAIADFLATGGYQRYLRRICKTYSHQVALMTEAIGRFFPDETKVTRPSGGFILWVELPKQMDALELYERALLEKISIAPGHIFSATGKYSNFIRLNCGHQWSDTVERAISKLGQIIYKLY